MILILVSAPQASSQTYEEDFTGSNADWSCYHDITISNNPEPISCSTSGSAVASSPDGACGYGGNAKDFSISNADTLTVNFEATADDWGSNELIIKDSSGYDVIWERNGGGTGVNTGKITRSFDLSPYDSNFKLILGNADRSTTYCSYGDHGWTTEVYSLQISSSPGNIVDIVFDNSTSGHHFEAGAVVKGEESNLDCGATAEAISSEASYNPTVYPKNSSYSWCNLTASFDDTAKWKKEHGDGDSKSLLRPEVNFTTLTSGGEWETAASSNTFPNNPPTIEGFNFRDVGPVYGFNTTVRVNDTDNARDELDACELTFDDGSSSFTADGDLSSNPSNSDLYTCNYSNTNNTFRSSFKVLDQIDVDVSVQDIHGDSGSGSSQNRIPNTPPVLQSFDPPNESLESESPVTVSVSGEDPEGDEVALYLINATDGANKLLEKKSVSTSYNGGYDWSGLRVREPVYWYANLSDPYTNYTSDIFSFEKILSGDFRISIEVPTRSRSIIMTQGSERSVSFTVENPSARSKDINLSLLNVNASFKQGDFSRDITLGPGQQRTFRAIVEPKSPGDKNLVISSVDEETLLESHAEVPVVVEAPTVTEDDASRQVPGLTAINLLLLLTGGLVLFWVS